MWSKITNTVVVFSSLKIRVGSCMFFTCICFARLSRTYVLPLGPWCTRYRWQRVYVSKDAFPMQVDSYRHYHCSIERRFIKRKKKHDFDDAVFQWKCHIISADRNWHHMLLLHYFIIIILLSYHIVIILLLHMIILKGRQIVKICSLQRNMREIFVIRVSSANCGQVWRAQWFCQG